MRSSLILKLSKAFTPNARTLFTSVRPTSTLLRATPAKVATFTRFASISPNNGESSAIDLINKINENPEIREILQKFQSLLVSKGFNPEKPPSMMEVMRLFSDKEVRELAGQLKGKFDEAGIKISPDQMTSFMGMMKK